MLAVSARKRGQRGSGPVTRRCRLNFGIAGVRIASIGPARTRPRVGIRIRAAASCRASVCLRMILGHDQVVTACEQNPDYEQKA
jgi:hypothetical protein